MNIKDSTEVLSKRSNFAFPAAFGAFCHSLSGGLPRDLRRVARKLTRENAKVKADADKYQQLPFHPLWGSQPGSWPPDDEVVASNDAHER